jgi:hypothetical protein
LNTVRSRCHSQQESLVVVRPAFDERAARRRVRAAMSFDAVGNCLSDGACGLLWLFDTKRSNVDKR